MRIYLCDGSPDSFYSAVFSAYCEKEATIVCDNVQIGINDDTMSVINNKNHVERVKRKLALYDSYAQWEIENILKSNLPDRAERAYLYLKLILKCKTPVRNRLAEPIVLNALDAVKKVSRETERMRGFLRFTECDGGILYAPCSPDNDIITDLFPHFRRRFPNERFIIHDIKRKKAILYNGKAAVLAPMEKADIYLSSQEEEFCRLWKEYYRAVNIAARKNKRLQDNWMPRRYRKFMPETQ